LWRAVAHDEAEHGALYPIGVVVLDDAELIAAFDGTHTRIKRLMEHLMQLEGETLLETVNSYRRSRGLPGTPDIHPPPATFVA
jgi:hypothetical protein